MAVGLLKELWSTTKSLVFDKCVYTLMDFGFTVDDSNFFITKFTEDTKINRYRDTMYTMSFVEQREKLKCCKRICKFIKQIDYILQSHLHKIVRNQIALFEADVWKHVKYIPDDDSLAGTDLQAVLEGERTPDDPKVSTPGKGGGEGLGHVPTTG